MPVLSFELSDATQRLIGQLAALDVQSSQEKISQRIEELKREIGVLEGYYNTTAPICRLPPEILSATFELLLTESAQVYVPYRTRLSPDVVRVTHVCRHWREIALNCTHLWDNLDFAFPDLTNAMLDRSKDALLNVHYNVYARPETLDNFLRVLMRLRVERRPIGDLWLSYIDNLPWQTLPLYSPTTIKQFSLCAAPDSAGHRPSLVEFWNALNSMPHLETLQLEDILPLIDPRDNSNQSPPPITFPALHSLALTDTADELTYFFRILRVPRGVSVHLELSQFGAEGDDVPISNIPQLFASVQLSFGNSPQVRTPLQKLAISDFNFEIYPLASPGNNFTSPMHFSASDDGIHTITSYFDGLATILDFSTLSSLLVLLGPHPETWDEDAWVRLGQAPNLKVITFQKSHFQGFLSALGRQDLFPSLSVIRFVSINPIEDDVDVDGFIALLISALNSRVEGGRPVGQLSLMRVSVFDEQDVQRISEDVPSLEVVWDGYVAGSPPSDWGEDDEYNWDDAE